MRETTSTLHLTGPTKRAGDLKLQPDSSASDTPATRDCHDTSTLLSLQVPVTSGDIAAKLKALETQLADISLRLSILRKKLNMTSTFDTMLDCARRGQSWQDQLDGGYGSFDSLKRHCESQDLPATDSTSRSDSKERR